MAIENAQLNSLVDQADAHTTPDPTTPTVTYSSRAWRPNRPYGDKEFTICDKCGFQLRMLDARRDWTGGLVHAECVDERPITKRVRTQRSHVQLGWRHRT